MISTMNQHSLRGRLLSAAAFLSVAAAASAQPGVQPAKPATAPIKQPAAPIERGSLVQRDPATNKIVRVNGVLDAIALKQIPSITPQEWAAMEPVIADWTADVNQLVIDNIDFMERIDAGLYDTLDMNNQATVKYTQSVNNQLSSAGSLNVRLVQKNVINTAVAQAVMQTTNEYVQGIYAELASESAVPNNNADPGAVSAQQQKYANLISRYFQAVPSRDAREQYHRILLDSAGLIDQILAGLPAEAKAKADPAVAAVKAAPTDTAKMVAVRDLMNTLSFDQKRAFLAKAVQLGAAKDPFRPAPAMPAPAADAPKAN